jgi:hypothetical protein
MGIRSDTFYWAECDRCGNQIGGENDDGGYFLSETKEGVRKDVEHYDGRFEADGTVTCSTCIIEEGEATDAPA